MFTYFAEEHEMVDGRKNGPMEGRMDGLMREQEGMTAKFPGV